jgi:hypothetical protein
LAFWLHLLLLNCITINEQDNFFKAAADLQANSFCTLAFLATVSLSYFSDQKKMIFFEISIFIRIQRAGALYFVEM